MGRDDGADLRAGLSHDQRGAASEGFKPPQVIRLKLSKDYRGVAGTANDRIVGSVDYFRRHHQGRRGDGP